MEVQPPGTVIEVNGGTNNFISVPPELIPKDNIPNNRLNRNEDVNNENLGDEIMRKSVSWAEEEVLVETREIEVRHRKNFSLRILELLCCTFKSGDEKNVEEDHI